MALIKCSECSAEISDRANCCPKCGAPVVAHKWRCSKCGNIISEEPCPYCSSVQTVVNMDTATENNSQPIAKSKKTNSGWEKIVGVFIMILFLTSVSPWFADIFESSYYVAKLPSFSAGAVKVDGYMHKDKTCCQKIANSFGAEVICIKPKDEAGTNEYGQSVYYEDAFNYCPLCCY